MLMMAIRNSKIASRIDDILEFITWQQRLKRVGSAISEEQNTVTTLLYIYRVFFTIAPIQVLDFIKNVSEFPS